MRSKWLDWPRVPRIMEKVHPVEPAKPTKAGSVSFVGTSPCPFSITREAGSALRLPASDPYAERMRAALSKINPPNYPAAMVPWLGTAHPDLYAELTSRIPDQVHRLWTERAPLERFEAILALLVSVHGQCCDLYRAAHRENLPSSSCQSH